MRLLAVVSAVVGGTFLAAVAQQVAPAKKPQPEAPAPKAQAPAGPPVVYAVVFRPGEAWLKGKELMEQPHISEHIQYLGERLEAGELLMAGPFLDHTGGIVLYRTATIDQARKLVESDPCVTTKVLTYTVQPWLVPMAAPELNLGAAIRPAERPAGPAPAPGH